MKAKKYIGEKEYKYLTDLLKTYADIVKTSDGFPLVQATFKGAGYAIANIVNRLEYDLSDHLTLEQLIKRGDIYVANYILNATTATDRAYWRGAYDEILELIEKYFDIKLRRDI